MYLYTLIMPNFQKKKKNTTVSESSNRYLKTHIQNTTVYFYGYVHSLRETVAGFIWNY